MMILPVSSRGLFITIHDKGHIATMLNSWPEENIKVLTQKDLISRYGGTFSIIYSMCVCVRFIRPLW